MKKIILMAFALLSVLVLSGCNIDESKTIATIRIENTEVIDYKARCLSEGGEFKVEHKLFTNVYSCQIDLTKEE